MAESYGPWVNHQRVWFSYSVSGVSQGSTHCTVSVTAYLQMDSVSTSAGTWAQSWYGHWGSGSQSPYWNFARGESKAIASGSYSIALTDSAQTIGFGATGRSYWGTVGHEVYPVVPARFARTPSGLAVARVSDTQHTVSWTLNSTYTAVVVQRSTDNASWVQVGRPTGNAASFTDTTTVANQRYYYRVAGVGGSGQSAWSAVAGPVYTSPAAPASVAAARSGMDIVVSATGLPAHATSFDIEDAGAVVASSVALPWTHVAPSPANPHSYRVRGKVGAVLGAWSTVSNTVQLLTAPLAPSGLAPNGGLAASDSAVRLTWVHNPVDTSPQTVYELRHRPVSGAWTTLSGTTAAFVDVALAAGDFEWQVRTKGDHADWSPWSAVATVTVIDRPGVAILSPVGDVGIAFAALKWSWFQVQGRPQSAWRAELVRDGAVVESVSPSGAATEYPFTSPLADGGTYSLRVQAATGEVWSAWDEETFTTIFPPPAAPDVVASWSEITGQHNIHVTPGALAEYAWTGVENESPSTMTLGEMVTTNLVPNPLMSESVAGWVSTGAAPAWNGALTATLAAGEGVYIDLPDVADAVLSVRVIVEAATPYRVALFDPTGTSVAYWSEPHVGVTDVLMEALEFTVGRPLRLHVSLDGGGLLRVLDAAVFAGPTVTRAFDGASQDEVATEYMTVERSIDGVRWEPVSAALVGDSAIQDGEGLTFGSTWYRVIAVSGLPSTASTVVEVISESGALWLSGGVGFGIAARLPYDPGVKVDAGRERTVKRYSGRSLPVAYAGAQLSRRVDVSGTILEDETDTIQVEALAGVAQNPEPIHMYRDPDGRRVYGSLSSVSLPRQSHGVWGYAFQLEETDR